MAEPQGQKREWRNRNPPNPRLLRSLARQFESFGTRHFSSPNTKSGSPLDFRTNLLYCEEREWKFQNALGLTVDKLTANRRINPTAL